MGTWWQLVIIFRLIFRFVRGGFVCLYRANCIPVLNIYAKLTSFITCWLFFRHNCSSCRWQESDVQICPKCVAILCVLCQARFSIVPVYPDAQPLCGAVMNNVDISVHWGIHENQEHIYTPHFILSFSQHPFVQSASVTFPLWFLLLWQCIYVKFVL